MHLRQWAVQTLRKWGVEREADEAPMVALVRAALDQNPGLMWEALEDEVRELLETAARNLSAGQQEKMLDLTLDLKALAKTTDDRMMAAMLLQNVHEWMTVTVEGYGARSRRDSEES